MLCEKIYLKTYFDFLGRDGAEPVLYTYLPYNLKEMKRENDKRRSILICPGGAYGFCSEREGEPVALKFLGEGFNCFILKYSTAPHRFPTQLREAAAAMELISLKAEEWNCDAQKIAVMGFSAGGHLAAHYSLSYDCPEVREAFPDSKRPNAAVLGYPVITADERYAHRGSFENLLGHMPDKKEAEKFSCERLVNENTPPTFLWHTAEDPSVPVMNTLLYAAALSENKVPTEAHIFTFGGHGMSTCDSQTLDSIPPNAERNKIWLPSASQWLKMIL